MIGLHLVPAPGGFFDRRKVAAAADRKTRAVLMRFGAFVRRRAQSSIRTRKAPSRPGEPPSGHIGTLKRFILFDVDMKRRSVVIGAALVPGMVGRAPASLEHGGPSAGTVHRKRGTEQRPIVVRERPFMGPAFEIETQKSLPGLWQTIPFR
jgi:hypothetical protein